MNTIFHMLPHEVAILKHNEPGPSGKMGAYQTTENHVHDQAHACDGTVVLDEVMFERLHRELRAYGDGGPNRRLRKACIPALRRVGIKIEVQRRPKDRKARSY